MVSMVVCGRKTSSVVQCRLFWTAFPCVCKKSGYPVVLVQNHREYPCVVKSLWIHLWPEFLGDHSAESLWIHQAADGVSLWSQYWITVDSPSNRRGFSVITVVNHWQFTKQSDSLVFRSIESLWLHQEIDVVYLWSHYWIIIQKAVNTARNHCEFAKQSGFL